MRNDEMTPPPIEVDVAVIGGGSAGLAAAQECARRGLATLLISETALGGEMLAGETLGLHHLRRLTIDTGDKASIDPGLWKRAQTEVAAMVEKHRTRLQMRLADSGVEVLKTRARFVAQSRLRCENGVEVYFDRAIIAVGAERKMLPGAPFDGRLVLTGAQALALESPPKTALVIGGDKRGTEMVSLLCRLGTEVTWVMDEYGILPSFDRELADGVGDCLMGRGIKLVHGKRAERLEVLPDAEAASVRVHLDGGKTYDADVAILAMGNVPRLADLGLDELNLSPDAQGTLRVARSGQTSVTSVYGAGTCTGRTSDLGAAETMGSLVAQQVFKDSIGPAGEQADEGTIDRFGVETLDRDPNWGLRAVFCEPEVAQVGLTPDAGRGRPLCLHTLRYEEGLLGLLHGICDEEEKGFMRIVCDSDSGKVLGATVLGPRAAEVAGAVSLAIALGATDDALGALPAVEPTVSALLLRALH